MALPPPRLERFARHIVIPEIGGAGQALLAERHAVLVGLGGIGSPVLQYLAGVGIGRLTLIDDGVVELSNLQRQTIYTERDIGHGKAVAARRWMMNFDAAIDVEISDIHLSSDNAADTIGTVDLVIDGTDTFATRLAVSDACVAARIPLLSAAVGRFQGQVGAFRGHLPAEPCYRCFVGDAFDADDCDSCAEDGMLGAMAGWVGTLGAMQAIKCLVEPLGTMAGPNWGHVQLLDGLAPALRSFAIAKDPACRACGPSSQ